MLIDFINPIDRFALRDTFQNAKPVPWFKIDNFLKAEVAEQLAAILRKRTDTPEQMRDRLPPYLVRAIDYVTGGYVPGAPAVAPETDADDEEIWGAGPEGAAPVEA